jgi:hypothetical protein
MCYHPESGVSVVSCSGIASFTGFGGRSALLILVRVALLLPSDDEPFSAFTLPGPGKQAAVAEASDSPLRRQAQPSKEHLAVAGVGRFPSVLPSGFRLRSFRQSGFHLSGQNIFPLKVRALPPDFRTFFLLAHSVDLSVNPSLSDFAFYSITLWLSFRFSLR